MNFCESVECLDTVEVVELGENCPCPSLMKSTGPFIADFAGVEGSLVSLSNDKYLVLSSPALCPGDYNHVYFPLCLFSPELSDAPRCVITRVTNACDGSIRPVRRRIALRRAHWPESQAGVILRRRAAISSPGPHFCSLHPTQRPPKETLRVS